MQIKRPKAPDWVFHTITEVDAALKTEEESDDLLYQAEPPRKWSRLPQGFFSVLRPGWFARLWVEDPDQLETPRDVVVRLLRINRKKKKVCGQVVFQGNRTGQHSLGCGDTVFFLQDQILDVAPPNFQPS